MRLPLWLLCAAFIEASEAANNNPKAQDFCAKKFPVKTVTVLVRRFAKPTPTAPEPLNRRVAAAATDKNAKLLSTLSILASHVAKTFCSCIQTPKIVTARTTPSPSPSPTPTLTFDVTTCQISANSAEECTKTELRDGLSTTITGCCAGLACERASPSTSSTCYQPAPTPTLSACQGSTGQYASCTFSTGGTTTTGCCAGVVCATSGVVATCSPSPATT